jgi:cell wall-associated NlpC family hydrolase
MSLTEVTQRITEIQARLGLRPPVAPGAPGTSGSQFSSVLASALGLATTAAGPAAAGVTSATPAAPGTARSAGERAVALARGYAGVPYLWGGTDPAKGLDCSGLTQLVYGQLGIRLPRVAADQATAGSAVPSLADAQPGDLVFFGQPAHHVGIVAGGGKMIDAPHTGSVVGLHEIAGYGQVSAIRRVVPATAGASPAPAASSGPAIALARAQLMSAAGLASLTALTPSMDRSANAWEALR